MTFFVKLDENGIPESAPILEDNLRYLFPGLFPFPHLFLPSEVEPLGFGIFEFTNCPTVEYPNKVVEVLPVKGENEIYYQTWEIQEMSNDEKAEATIEKADLIRRERNYRLAECDWTVFPYSPVSQEKQLQWVEYRQQLRDITSQVGFPWSVIWPDIIT